MPATAGCCAIIWRCDVWIEASPRTRCAPSPRLRGEGRAEGGVFAGSASGKRPLTRPPSAVDLSPQAGRGGGVRGCATASSSAASRPRIGIVIEARRRWRSRRARPNEMIAAVAVAAEPAPCRSSSRPQAISRPSSLPIDLDQVGIEHRRRCASACSTVWKRAGPLNTLAALRVSGISPSRPNGLVQSKPALAPVRRPCSDGSMVMPGMPCRIIRSWSAWKRVPDRPFDLPVVADVDVLIEHDRYA